MHQKLKRIFTRYTPATVASLVVALLILVGGSYIGYTWGFDDGAAYERQAALNELSEEGAASDVDFSVFWEVWDMLKRYHIKGGELTDQEFLYGAIEGLAGSFDDPNTTFFPPADAQKFEEDISGSFGGIGAEIGIVDKQLTITAPLKKSPAERAGVLSGDAVVKIDDVRTDSMSVAEAVKKIRGKIGTTVTLSIYRKGWEEARDIVITREVIIVPTLDYKILDNKIGYIQLYSFNENASQDFFEAAATMTLNGVKGIIFDLRDNPGGFLEVATYMSGWFLDRGDIIVTERFRDGEERVFRSRGNGVLKNTPVVFLMNEGSASASEILAGALKDQKASVLVGKKSFGKGTVQELSSLSDGSSIKITVANWVLPSGKVLSEGIDPDYEVDYTAEDREAGRDPQFDKALEVMNAKIGIKSIATPVR